MTEELKPVRCGCGGKAQIDTIYYEGAVRYGIKQQYYVECQECRTRTFRFDTESEAITAWNRAMGERTAKAEWSEVDGCHLCGECGFAVCPNCDVYCAGCGARLEWE